MQDHRAADRERERSGRRHGGPRAAGGLPFGSLMAAPPPTTEPVAPPAARGDAPAPVAVDETAPAAATGLGISYALLAYGWWGTVVPEVLFRLKGTPPVELLAHRVVWGLPILLCLVALGRGWSELRRAVTTPAIARWLVVTAGLIAINWFGFILAVVTDRTLDASLGYFMNPLLSVALGMLVLGERLRIAQYVAVAIAAVGVLWQLIAYGSLPWISLMLAGSFGLYGLLRKQARVGPVTGLTVEMTVLLPLAIVTLIVLAMTGTMQFGVEGGPPEGWMVFMGLATVLPLVWFTGAARRLRLSTVGFFQYIAPSGQLLIAVLHFGEPFTRQQAITFGFIWLALAIFVGDLIWQRRRERPAV